MEHTEAESLADKLRDHELFTVGELTLIAVTFQVKAQELLIALVKDETSGTGIVINVAPPAHPLDASLAYARSVIKGIG